MANPSNGQWDIDRGMAGLSVEGTYFVTLLQRNIDTPWGPIQGGGNAAAATTSAPRGPGAREAGAQRTRHGMMDTQRTTNAARARTAPARSAGRAAT